MVAKKPPPAELAQAIVRASRNLERSKQEFEQAIVAALKAGASGRLTAEVAGVALGTVQEIAKRHGWPDATERRTSASEVAHNEVRRSSVIADPDDYR